MRPTTRILAATACCLLTSQAAMAQRGNSPDATNQPNATGQISLRALNYFMQIPVNRTVAISENVLGTSVRGTAHTQGQVVPLLVPDSQRGSVQLRFTGTSHSPHMVGQNGPATIFSSATSRVDVRKMVVLDDQGIHLLPAEANADTRVSINGVTANRRVVERIARRRASRAETEAQAVTSQRTRLRLQQEIDRDAAGPLQQADAYFETGFRQPLRVRDALPKFMRFMTTNEHLRLVVRQCSHSSLPSPTRIPEIDPRHDIAVAIHETAIESIYEVFFAGKTVIDRECLHTAHFISGEYPRTLRVHDRTPRWSVIFAQPLPLEVTFAEGLAGFTLHLTSLEYGDRRHEGDFIVSVRYRLERTPRGPRLDREGDLQVEGTITNSSGELMEALAVLRSKFSAVFPPVMTFDGLTPPTGGIWDKVGALELVKFEAEDGWLMVDYQLPRPAIVATRRDSREKR
jgi:hypothetical protein